MTLELRREHYLDQPCEVALETLARCNAACTFCPYPTLDRIGTQMPTDLIYKLIDEMATWRKSFAFSPFKVSEPLLDKRLHTILKRFNHKVPHANIRIFTNGSALTWERAEELHDLDKVNVFVSLNSHLKEVYEPLMALSFDRVIANLDRLHSSDFRHEVNILQVGDITVSEPFQRYVFDRWPRFKCIIVKKDGWLGFTEADDLVIPDTPCARWFELSITATGVVSTCCMDGEGKFPIGDVTKQTMLEVYNSPHWRDRRERMISRKEIYPCSTCSY